MTIDIHEEIARWTADWIAVHHIPTGLTVLADMAVIEDDWEQAQLSKPSWSSLTSAGTPRPWNNRRSSLASCTISWTTRLQIVSPVPANPGEPTRRLSRLYVTAVLVGMVLSLPWVGMGVVGALRSNSNDPRQWLPRGFDDTDKYHWLQAHFGSDEPAVVSWEGCTLDDPRAEQLAEALLENPETAYFERALTGPGVIERLVSEPLELPRSEAIRRLQGLLIGPDGHTTCVLLTLSKRGSLDRVAAIEEIRRVALKRCGLKPEQLRLGGPKG